MGIDKTIIPEARFARQFGFIKRAGSVSDGKTIVAYASGS